MSFPFKGIGFDWAYTLVDLGKEDDRSPLKKVFRYLSSKNLSLPDFEEFLDQSSYFVTAGFEKYARPLIGAALPRFARIDWYLDHRELN